MKKLILLIVMVLTMFSCSDNCEEEEQGLKAYYYDLMEKAVNNQEQVDAFERELDRRLRDLDC